MRIALLTGEHPALGHLGGVGTYTATLAAALRAAGATVLTVVADGSGAIHEIDVDGVRPLGRWLGPAAVRPCTAAATISARLRTFAPHVVEVPNWGGLGACLDRRPWALVVRLSTPVMGIRPRDALRRLGARLHHTWEAATVRRADLVIADSAAVGHLASVCYGRGAEVVIPHPFPAREPAPAPPLGHGVLAVGRLEHRKATDILLAAWRRVRMQRKDWHLHLVGADSAGFGARCLAALGSDGVTAHGPLTAEALAAVAATCPVAVLPSRWESFGMVALEAWNRGQAVVVSDAGGLPEVVGDAGVVVPRGDAEALAGGLLQLITDASARHDLAQHGRARLLARFAPGLCATATLAAYRRAIARVQRDRTDQQWSMAP